MNARLHSIDLTKSAAVLAAHSEALTTAELCAALARLCEAERQTEWLMCRHLAELTDRFERRDPALGAYADVYQLARLRFRMSVRRARERVRIGRALRKLPLVEQAFVEGRLGYTRVREVTRVASGEDEAHWLRLAQELPQRQLERRVAEAGPSEGNRAEHDRTKEPATVRWASRDSLELRMMLPAPVWALLERAMEGARRQSESVLSDAAALEAVLRDALAKQQSGEDGSDVRQLVVLYTCRSCERSELETGAGAVELAPAEAARLACGRKVCDLEREGRTVTSGGPIPAAVRRAVLLRDRMRCRTPGCSRRRYVDVHHIRSREHGGEHSRRNLLTICTACHTRVHDGRLRIEGDTDGELRFFDVDGELLGESPVTPKGHAAQDRSPEASALLCAMGKRGAWHPDELSAASGLSAAEVACGLLRLELAGRVRMGLYGYEPLASS